MSATPPPTPRASWPHRHIYQVRESLDADTCAAIRRLFQESSFVRVGVTRRGVEPGVKDTTDLHFQAAPTVFADLDRVLYAELHRRLAEYLRHVNADCPTLLPARLTDSGFNVQRYARGAGKYVYHNDEAICAPRRRILAYLWYLNTVSEGGETEFFGDSTARIRPERGTLLLFPTCWTFPHCGRVPLSDDKFVVTGWVYADMDAPGSAGQRT